MPFFTENIKRLEALSFPSKQRVLDALGNLEPLAAVTTARTDCPTIQSLAGATMIALHSTRDPVREAARWAGSFSWEQKRLALLAGMGLGYPAEAVLDQAPALERFVIIEPNLSHLCAALHYRDLSSLLSFPGLSLFLGPLNWYEKPLLDFLDSLPAQEHEMQMLIHQTSLRTLPESEKGIQEIFSHIRNMKTSRRTPHAEKKEANRAANAQAVKQSCSVAELRGAYSGRPCVLVAPGPSLEKNAHLLHACAGRAVVIALDAALKPLQRFGLCPDFAVTLDPQPKVAQYFPDEFAPELKLVFFPESLPDVVSRFSPQKRFVSKTSAHKCFDHEADAGALFVSGSVFIPALDLGLSMGCEPIILVGADFAVNPERTHATGSPAGKAAFARQESRSCQGYFGLPAMTTDSYLLYLRATEDYLRKMPGGIRVYNATEGGAAVQGAHTLPLRHAIFSMIS